MPLADKLEVRDSVEHAETYLLEKGKQRTQHSAHRRVNILDAL